MLMGVRRTADQAGLFARDEQGGDGFEQSLMGGMRLEGGAELRLVEQRPQPAGDAARDIDAAQRLEGERQPAGKASEEAYEQSRRRLCGGFTRKRARGNRFRRMARRLRIERAGEPHKTGA